jgi:class 3 adenylate cyclase
VLFCDLRGFTFLCERERPEDVVDLLNTFYERACALVAQHGGTVNKLLGDGMLALFGGPGDRPDHADAAAQTALGLMLMVNDLRRGGGVWTHLAIGIGLDTGEVVLGPVGSRERAEYTAIGSPVNRAARLQSLAERENRRIIVSQTTSRELRRRYRIVSLGAVALKGFASPEEAYYLASRGSTAREADAPRGRLRARRRRAPSTHTTLTPTPPTPTPETTSPDPDPTGETEQLTRLRVDAGDATLPGTLAQSESSIAHAGSTPALDPAAVASRTAEHDDTERMARRPDDRR